MNSCEQCKIAMTHTKVCYHCTTSNYMNAHRDKRVEWVAHWADLAYHCAKDAVGGEDPDKLNDVLEELQQRCRNLALDIRALKELP